MVETEIKAERIGVFDSGVGGLTVLRALQAELPHESFLYLGDTARLPYGTKSPETVIRYAKQASEILIHRGVKLLVVACNTATTLALDALHKAFPGIPIIGVLEPGARAASSISKNGNIAVIATESTIKSKGYQRAILAIRPEAKVSTQSCSLFVALAEEGWLDGEITEAIADRYLKSLFEVEDTLKPDCLVLGCTHFPALAASIQKVLGDRVSIVDSAKTTAETVRAVLEAQNLRSENLGNGDAQFLVTDAPDRFARVAQHFLGAKLNESDIELVDF